MRPERYEQSPNQTGHELLGCVKAGEMVEIAYSPTHRAWQQPSIYGSIK
jgi:hypothetical protein